MPGQFFYDLNKEGQATFERNNFKLQLMVAEYPSADAAKKMLVNYEKGTA